MKILLAVDGSKHALAAVQSVIRHADWYREPPGVELVTVHLPVPLFYGVHMFVGKKDLERYYGEQGQAAMEAARRELDAAKIPYRTHVLVGEPAQRIVEHAVRTRCDLICMGSRGLGDLGKALLGSVATKVLNLAKVPVLLVQGRK